MKPQPKMHHTQVQLLDAFKTVGPMTRLEVERYLRVDDSTAGKRIKRLRDRKLLRVVAWLPTESRRAPVYAVADGKPDVPEPPRASQAERDKRYRERHRVRIAVRRYGPRTSMVGLWAGL